MKKLTRILISIYQILLPVRNFIGHYLLFSPNTCRFYPTCSQYMIQATNRYGIMRGGLMGLRRIIRCNPFNDGGCDPVPVK